MDQVRRFLAKFYRGVGTPLAARCEALVAKGEWGQLQKLAVSDPTTFVNHKEYFDEALVIELTRKLLLPGDANARKQAAVKTFWDSESQCLRTNGRLLRYIDERGSFTAFDVKVMSFINLWRKEVRRVLGRCPSLLEPKFSGGSTLSDAGKLVTIPDKMSSNPTVYAGYPDVLTDSIRFTPLGEHRFFEYATANRFFTVPKDSSKDRGCCVEASLNMSMQLAAGTELRKRYRAAYGVDLRHAQQLHRRLARDASMGLRDLATIDLSNASDTVAKELIRLILPEDWFVLLNSLRAKRTLVDDKVVFLEKFSSMGNGFTFELETLVFRSLVEVIGCEQAWVYGDDIIVPMSESATVLKALDFFGFTPNVKKTFCEGPFRESCGGDFFLGESVRALYLKEIPDEPQKWMKLANGLRRLDPDLQRFNAAWWFCVEQVPKAIRVFGPSSLGDLVFHDPSAIPTLRAYKTPYFVKESRRNGDSMWVTKYTTNSPAYFWRTYAPVSRKYNLGKYWTYRVATAAGSLGVPSELTTRDDITGYHLTWTAAYGLTDHSWWCGSADGSSQELPWMRQINTVSHEDTVRCTT